MYMVINMEHNHNHEHIHNHSHNHESYKNIKIAFLLNILFSILEAIGGILINSISIITDSVHDFGDAISIGVSYLLEKKSTKESNSTHTYGYLRYSLLGALITSIILLIGSTAAIYNAVLRIINPEDINSDGMIIFAILGVIINGYAAYRTSHGEKHNEKAINLHMLEDVLGWVAVLIGSIFIKVFNLPIIDPILSILIGLYILFHVYRYIKEVFDIFMEKTPEGININEIKKEIKEHFKDISNIHHVHIWSLDGVNNCMTCHVLLNKKMTAKDIMELKDNIKNELKEFNINHTTLEIEYFDENCKSKEC